MLPKSYNHKFAQYMEELWNVWRSLGVYSDGDIYPIAPEEAITGLCILGRYDQRLFDEALSFTIEYSRLISKNRMLSLVKKMDQDSVKVFKVISLYLKEINNDARFYSESKLSNGEIFFRSLNHKKLFTSREHDPLFKKSGFIRNAFKKSEKLRKLNFISNNNPWIKAKLLLGNSVRVDTLMELICNSKCTAPSIAFNTGYTQKSIWNVLTDFESAGFVNGEKFQNRIIYTLSDIGNKQFSQFKVIKKIPNVSNWLKIGHYLSAFSKLPETASDLFIKSEEKRIEKVISDLQITKNINSS